METPPDDKILKVQVGVSATSIPEDFNTGGKISKTSSNEGGSGIDAAQSSP